jgi:hypothetical protein
MTSISSQASAQPTVTGAAAQLAALQPGDVVSAVVAKIINATTLQLLSAIGSLDVQVDASSASALLTGGSLNNGQLAKSQLGNGQVANGSVGNGSVGNAAPAAGSLSNGPLNNGPLGNGAPGNRLPANASMAHASMANASPAPASSANASSVNPSLAAGLLAAGARVELVVAGTRAEPTFTLRSPPSDSGAPTFAVATAVLSAKANASPAINASPLTTAALSAAEPLAQAAAAILRGAVARQGGLAQLYADLGAAVRQTNAAMPKPVVAAIAPLFAARLQPNAEGDIDAGELKAALLGAGVAGNAVTAAGQPFARAADMGVLLSQLRQALKTWADSDSNSPAASSDGSSDATSDAAPATVMRQAPAKVAVPMPPYRDGPTVPQALARPSLPDGATPREMALHLIDKTDAAAARQTLLQIASLPDRSDAGAPRGGVDAARMMFDIPLATPQGTVVAQLRVERDGNNAGDDAVTPVWRASFSVDVEPIGPVHVRIALANGKTTVVLNAERAASAASLNAGLPHLEAGLRDADIEPGTISCRATAPAVQPGPPGMFVDQPT